MAQPNVTTVKIDTHEFKAFSTQFAVATPYDEHGMPIMGATHCAIEIVADMHDNQNLSFDKLQAFFQMSDGLTADKVKPMKITYWADDSSQNALSTFTFDGWISSFTVLSGSGTNHALVLKLQPRVDQQQFINIQHGN